MDELKPCPFCGGRAEIVIGDYNSWTEGYAVECSHCCLTLGAYGRLGETYQWMCVYENKADAVDAWNRRVGVGR